VEASARATELDDYFAGRGPALRRTAYMILHDWHIAEDMVQTTFVQLYVAWPRIRYGGLDAYARRTLVNACLTHLRKRRREQLMPETPETMAAKAPDRSDLTAAIRQLPPQQRAVVALRFLDDLSVLETAAALGVAEGTVKSQTSRALAGLRQLLPELEVAEEVLQ
jgi:RNA polymerase sigma-70 factor (sigma-E family)